MHFIRLLWTFAALGLCAATSSAGQDPRQVISAPEGGWRWTVPALGWNSKTQRDGQGLTGLTVSPAGNAGYVRLQLTVTCVAASDENALRAYLTEQRRSVANDASISKLKDDRCDIAGQTARGFHLFQHSAGVEYEVRVVFLRRSGLQYRFQFHAPADLFAKHWQTAARLLAGFELIELDARAAERARLRSLSARCGCEVDWAPDWTHASKRARDHKRLIVVSIFTQPGFELGNTLNEGVFMSREILDLMRHRFVGLRWARGDAAPFTKPEVFGLSGSTFGVGLLVCDAQGAVLKQIFETNSELVAEALRDALAAHVEFAPPPVPKEGNSLAERTLFLLESGQLDAARVALGAMAPDEAIELRVLRLRLHLIERHAREADRVLAWARTDPRSREGVFAAQLDLAAGALCMGTDRAAEAAEAFRSCLTRSADDSERAQARLALGMLAYASGEREQARDIWTALTLDLPEQPSAWSAAAVLSGPLLELDHRPKLGWADAATRSLAQLPAPAPRHEHLDLEAAFDRATTWLLESQRADGGFDTLRGERDAHLAPQSIHLASQVIAARSLARAATHLEQGTAKERAAVVRAASIRAYEHYLEGRRLSRAYPRPVAFMDYTSWEAAYGLSGALEALEQDGVTLSGANATLRSSLRAECNFLISDLVRIQAPNGGWSYYLSGSVGAAASDTVMSFTTATVLLALECARTRGFEVPAQVLTRGRASLVRLRGANGMFEYMRQGPSRHSAGDVPPEGSAARAPVCTSALQASGNLEAAAMTRALNAFVEHLHGFGDQSRRALMHTGSHGQGSHYLLYDYSSAAEAMRECKAVEVEQRREVRDAILRELARCRSADGSYVDNPLIGPVAATGLAVLTLSDLRVIALR